MSKGILHCDSFGYCMGGLYQYVAHSPGYVGFCTLGRIINSFVHDINRSFVLLNLGCTLLGVLFCHSLARAMGFAWPLALLAAACYSFSVCTLYFSTVALSYAVEGMFATLIGLLCYRAIQARSLLRALAATAVWAASGAFRPTTTAFLLPLWAFSLWRSGQRASLPLHFALAVPVILGWNFANRYFLEAKAGFSEPAGKQFFALQVMMPLAYDPANLEVTDNEVGPTSHYHWPFVELAAWVDQRVGTGILPDSPDYPRPSPSRALSLAGVQLLKLAFYTLLSLPSLLAVLVFLVFKRRSLTWPGRSDLAFLAVWVLPAAAFFVLGHFGSFGYLQVFLAGWALFACQCLFGGWTSGEEIADGFRAHHLPGLAGLLLTAAGLTFYMLAAPAHGTSSFAKTADVVLLQYTGRAIQQKYSVARSTINRPDPRQLAVVPLDCESDEELLRFARQIRWAPKSHYKPPDASP
jgi:hypothetical protein